MAYVKHILYTNYAKKRRGFTLIEISIALVIIGLIIGGVLVGKTLIETATMRQQFAQINQYVTAVNAFKLKYNAIPGDIPNAVALGLGTSTALHDGNGNGGIGCLYGNRGYNKEAQNFYYHLSRAGLIESNVTGHDGVSTGASYTAAELDLFFIRGTMKGAALPSWVIPSQFMDQWPCSSGSDYFAKAGNGFGLIHMDGVYFNAIYSGQTGRMFDSKFDDGAPITGKIVAGSSTVGSNIHAVAYGMNGDWVCGTSNGTNNYSSSTDSQCAAGPAAWYCCKLNFVNQF